MTAIARLEGREQKGGYEKPGFLAQVQKRYRRLAEAEPDRWCVLDATGSPTQLVNAVVEDMEKQGILAAKEPSGKTRADAADAEARAR